MDFREGRFTSRLLEIKGKDVDFMWLPIDGEYDDEVGYDD